jgi:hypothetical protein
METKRDLLVLGAFVLASAGAVHAAAPATARCSVAKLKCATAYVKGMLGCKGRTARIGPANALAEAACVGTVEHRWSNGTTGCLDKANLPRPGRPCPDGASDATLHAELRDLVDAIVAEDYPDYPDVDACAAGRLTCMLKYVAGIVGCDGKALGTGSFASDDPITGCTGKAIDRLALEGVGCLAKLQVAGTVCGAVPADVAANRALVDRALDRIECEQAPAGAVLEQTTSPSGGVCGTTDGSRRPTLACGGLYIGNGGATTPAADTPAGSVERFDLAGGRNRLCPRPASEEADGSNRHCSDIGCFFGSPLPVANGGLSACIDDVIAARGYGLLTIATGDVTADVTLVTVATVTGNASEPCPRCVDGTCDATALNAGATCVSDSDTGESHDCEPVGTALPPFTVGPAPLTTARSERADPAGFLCPSQTIRGAFGDPTATHVVEGAERRLGNLADGTGAGVLGSVFCIPGSGNALVDAAVGLPGPGALSLAVEVGIRPVAPVPSHRAACRNAAT